MAGPLGLNEVWLTLVSWADAGAWPRLLECVGRWPGSCCTEAEDVTGRVLILPIALQQHHPGADFQGQ